MRNALLISLTTLVLACVGCAKHSVIAVNLEHELTRSIAVQVNAPDYQGLTAFPICPGHGYLVMSTEENDEFSYVHLFRYVESRKTFALDTNVSRMSRFDRDGHIAGLAIANRDGVPFLYFVNFDRWGKDDGVVAYTPFFNSFTDEHEWAEREGKRTIHAHLIGGKDDRLNRGSGLAALETPEGVVLIVTRWHSSPQKPEIFTPQKYDQVKEFKHTKRDGPPFRAWSQGLEFTDPDGKFLLHTANGLGFSWIDIYANDAPSEPLFVLRYERGKRRQWIEEPVLTAGGWLLLPFEKVDKLVGVPAEKLVTIIEESYPSTPNKQTKAQAEFLAMLKTKANTLGDSTPPEFVPFPWETKFWEGGPETPCYDRIVELRRVWGRDRMNPTAEARTLATPQSANGTRGR